MKLSDVRGDRTLDVLAEAIEPIYSMAQDEAVRALFRADSLAEGEDARDHIARKLVKGVPSLLKAHKADVLAVLAAIKGVGADEYAASVDLLSLLRDLTELLTDEVTLGFLTSLAKPTTSGAGE